MNFKEFYKHIYFDIDKSIHSLYSAKQGDTKSRGFYVTLLVNGVVMPVTDQSLTFYAEKPDKTRVMVQAIKDDDIFRVDLPNQAFAVAGVLKCELTLRGQDGEQISNKTFKMVVDPSIQDGSIVSKDERGILDRAFELAEDIIPRIELLDVELLENVQSHLDLLTEIVSDHEDDISGLGSDLTDHKEDQENPHKVTKTQVGLGNVDNIQQASKAEFEALQQELESHKNDFTTLNTEVVEARQGASNLVTNINFIKSRINAIDPFAIFGVAWDKSSNPTLTRTDAAVGLVANVGIDDEVVQNDFDRVQIFGEIHDVEDSLGNVFVRIPKFYIRKTDTPTQKTWQISKTKHKGFYLPWCFWDFENHRELPYIDFGKYKASLSLDNRLESKPDVPPLVSRNIVQFREYAQNNNVDGLKGYQQLDVHAHDVLQTLFYIEFATLHSQSVMAGFTSGRYGVETDLAVISESNTNRIIVSNTTASQYRVGQTISVGTTRYGIQTFYGRTITSIEDYNVENKAIYFDGDPVDIASGSFLQNTGWINGFSERIAASSGSITTNNGKYPCAYRGIESPWGDIWQFVDGVNINDWQAWVALNAEEYASNVFAYPYRQLSYVNSDENGYAKYMGYDPKNPFAEFPVEVGAGSSTYYSDYYYQNTGQRIAHVGGSWNSGSYAGLSYWALTNTSSHAYVNFGGRLLKKPL